MNLASAVQGQNGLSPGTNRSNIRKPRAAADRGIAAAIGFPLVPQCAGILRDERDRGGTLTSPHHIPNRPGMQHILDLCLGWTNWVPYKPHCPDFRTVLAHKHAHTHEWLLPFVSFCAKPNPALPAVEERERELPPSIQFQFTFQFQGALLARLCLSEAKAANKTWALSKQKESNCGIIL